MAELVLYLRCPGGAPVEVRTGAHCAVRSLECFLPDRPPCAFYLCDFELCANFSLAYYGIASFSVVTAVPAPPRAPPKCEPPAVADRLTDQFFRHIEGTTSSYRKLVGRFMRLGGAWPKKRQQRTTVIPSRRSSRRPRSSRSSGE
jgi:hypothetical protein